MSNIIRKTIDFTPAMYKSLRDYGEQRGCRNFGEIIRDICRMILEQNASFHNTDLGKKSNIQSGSVPDWYFNNPRELQTRGIWQQPVVRPDLRPADLVFPGGIGSLKQSALMAVYWDIMGWLAKSQQKNGWIDVLWKELRDAKEDRR